MIISEKGQVVIPAHLRKKYNWKPGTRVVIKEAYPTHITFQKEPSDDVPVGTKYAGSLKGIISTKEYLAMKEEDKLLEERHV